MLYSIYVRYMLEHGQRAGSATGSKSSSPLQAWTASRSYFVRLLPLIPGLTASLRNNVQKEWRSPARYSLRKVQGATG